ncbi:MAG TPA: amino acid adenylation domain-containing protein, partial [Acidimicrobiales bacterium]|nr:amino acid adenylation domain-containing protein [Acidimicrobiales bacterium]
MLHLLFEAVVERHADRVAIAPPGRAPIAYHELNHRADGLARRLRGLVQAEDIVAILLGQDDPDLYAAQLAASKAGGAFLCLDGRFPDGHLEGVLGDARPAVVLTDPDGRRRLRSLTLDVGCPVLDAAGSTRGDGAGGGGGRSLPLDPSRLAYVVYTSGSTGQPKGVMIEHRSILNLVRSDAEHFGITPDDRVAQTSSPAYDSSVEETWLAFAVGATLVPFDELTVRSGPGFARALGDEGITVLCGTPTMLRTLAPPGSEAALPTVRILYTGGEPLTDDLARRWARGRWLENGYGPTECTVTVLRGRIAPGGPVTIGRPVTGHRALVLDERMEEVPPGRPGELCIAGVGVARGYWRRPDLTAERFVIHPAFGRLYRTGDMVRRSGAGELEYLGRIDGQVKLRGYRIELGAVEAHLAACPGVEAAVCRLQHGRDRSVLVAHVVPTDCGSPPPVADLQAALRRSLPEYMVPSGVGVLAALPTTVSGKVDRSALPDLTIDLNGEGRFDGSVAGPGDPLEAVVVAAFAEGLDRPPATIAVDDDFFLDLGGDSLAAVVATTALADDPRTAHASVRDLYRARTAAALAGRLREASPGAVPVVSDVAVAARPPRRRPTTATLVQSLCLLAMLVIVSAVSYGVVFGVWPALVAGRGQGGAAVILLLSSLAAAVVYMPLSVSVAVAVKRLLVGRYRPTRAAAWSSWHIRHWIVCLAARMIPWSLLEGTVFLNAVLRALGARVGRRVHLDRGV